MNLSIHLFACFTDRRVRKILWQKAMRLYRTEFPLGWKADWHSSELSAIYCFGETVFSEMASGFRFTVLGSCHRFHDSSAWQALPLKKLFCYYDIPESVVSFLAGNQDVMNIPRRWWIVKLKGADNQKEHRIIDSMLACRMIYPVECFFYRNFSGFIIYAVLCLFDWSCFRRYPQVWCSPLQLNLERMGMGAPQNAAIFNLFSTRDLYLIVKQVS